MLKSSIFQVTQLGNKRSHNEESSDHSDNTENIQLGLPNSSTRRKIMRRRVGEDPSSMTSLIGQDASLMLNLGSGNIKQPSSSSSRHNQVPSTSVTSDRNDTTSHVVITFY